MVVRRCHQLHSAASALPPRAPRLAPFPPRRGRRRACFVLRCAGASGCSAREPAQPPCGAAARASARRCAEAAAALRRARRATRQPYPSRQAVKRPPSPGGANDASHHCFSASPPCCAGGCGCCCCCGAATRAAPRGAAGAGPKSLKSARARHAPPRQRCRAAPPARSRHARQAARPGACARIDETAEGTGSARACARRQLRRRLRGHRLRRVHQRAPARFARVLLRREGGVDRSHRHHRVGKHCGHLVAVLRRKHAHGGGAAMRAVPGAVTGKVTSARQTRGAPRHAPPAAPPGAPLPRIPLPRSVCRRRVRGHGPRLSAAAALARRWRRRLRSLSTARGGAARRRDAARHTAAAACGKRATRCETT